MWILFRKADGAPLDAADHVIVNSKKICTGGIFDPGATAFDLFWTNDVFSSKTLHAGVKRRV